MDQNLGTHMHRWYIKDHLPTCLKADSLNPLEVCWCYGPVTCEFCGLTYEAWLTD